jgi:hypothetical protein
MKCNPQATKTRNTQPELSTLVPYFESSFGAYSPASAEPRWLSLLSCAASVVITHSTLTSWTRPSWSCLRLPLTPKPSREKGQCNSVFHICNLCVSGKLPTSDYSSTHDLTIPVEPNTRRSGHLQALNPRGGLPTASFINYNSAAP